MSMRKTLQEALKSEFQGIQFDDLDEVDRRVTAVLVWSGFSRLPQIRRQEKVWKVLRNRLTPAQQTRVGPILTVTPKELEAIRSDE